MSEATTVELDHEADIAEASRIMREAGWQTGDEWDGEYVYKKGPCVGGWPPGPRLTGYVKNIEKVRPGHPRYGDPAYPDTRAEAAQWLVDTYTPNLMTTEATLDPPVAEEQTPAHETHGETSEASSHTDVDSGEPYSAEGDADQFGEDKPTRGDDPIDADFTDLDLTAEEPDDFIGEELLDDFAADLPALEGGDVIEPTADEDPPPQGQDRFIGLDDLDRVKRLRIGDVAAAAAFRVAAIEEVAAEKAGEYAAIQAYVVTNLDKHTGAFTPQDDTSVATYHRFIALDEARRKIAGVEKHRKEATAYLLSDERTREEIVAFDPESGWPA